jgi:hypothetical protein
MSSLPKSPRSSRSRLLQGSVALLLAGWCMSSAAAQEYFSLSNALFFTALERSNPAMYEAVAKMWHTREELMLANGRRTIPYLREFNALFTNNIEFRLYSSEATGPHRWNWQTGLDGHYLLRMEMSFRVDATWTNVLSYEQPKFYLMEYNERGRFGCYPLDSFGVPKWTNFLASGGNLSAIGIRPQSNNPAPEFDFQWRNYYGSCRSRTR